MYGRGCKVRYRASRNWNQELTAPPKILARKALKPSYRPADRTKSLLADQRQPV